jgi:hypothetical protein
MTTTSDLPLTMSEAIEFCIEVLRNNGEVVDSGHWQGVSTTGKPEMLTKELLNLHFSAQIPETWMKLEDEVKPSIPWAEAEFQERVGGEPHNPHHSMDEWPWWHDQIPRQMTHTYSERFWPNDAGEDPVGRIRGLRYRYGDLSDVLRLLWDHPFTRQATFPIFFPEDTGASHGGRIPCTLHYHFMIRNFRMHLWYAIRSCDAVRHFRDDVYLACRLVQWVIDCLRKDAYEFGNPAEQSFWEDVKPGALNFTAYSFHVHKADEHLL